MTHKTDIRNAPTLHHEDIIALDFIRDPSKFFFRKHFNQGLRSHVIEILAPESFYKERNGEIRDGIRHYPRAIPLWILRIFKLRFDTLAPALEEAGRINILERYLPRNSYAKSNEFIVSFCTDRGTNIGLCGLQEYVDGKILDPWNLDHVGNINNAAAFVAGLKKMVTMEHMIPDLAGIGNLKIDSKCQLRLVDINNITMIRFTGDISLDDNGYPACDKSIEVLYRLEKKLSAPHLCVAEDPIYDFFLNPRRLAAVSDMEKSFYRRMTRRI